MSHNSVGRFKNGSGSKTAKGILTVHDFNSHLVRANLDPPRIPLDITQTYVARIVAPTTGGPLAGVGFANIMPQVPGGSTAWPLARINSVTYRGPAASDSTVRLQLVGDARIWVDQGTQGSERSCISVRPSLQQRMTWVSTTTLDSQFFVSPGSTGGSYLIDIELVLRTAVLPIGD
jgi:hypothetical protein